MNGAGDKRANYMMKLKTLSSRIFSIQKHKCSANYLQRAFSISSFYQRKLSTDDHYEVYLSCFDSTYGFIY